MTHGERPGTVAGSAPEASAANGTRGLLLAHFLADAGSGAIPTLLAVLVSIQQLETKEIGIVLLAGAIGLAIGQAASGPLADHLPAGTLSIAGLSVAGGALAAIGVVDGAAATTGLVAVGSLGAAAFHTDALRTVATCATAEAATRIGRFTLSGSIGYASGPLIIAAIVASGVPRPAIVLAAFPALGALIVARRGDDRSGERRRQRPRSPERAGNRGGWRDLARVAGLVGARSGVAAGIQSFVPIYLIVHLHMSRAESALMLGAILGLSGLATVAGGRAIRRFGPRMIAIGTLSLAVAALTSAVLSRHGLIPAELLAAALGLEMCFTATVILAHGCLPHRAGVATGLTLSIGTVIGGATAATLTIVAGIAGMETPLYVLIAIAVAGVLFALGAPRTSPRTGASRIDGTALLVEEGGSGR